jgi:hypothetical protein
LSCRKQSERAYNLCTARGGAVELTLVYVPDDNRITLKLTINRGEPNGPTPVFDAIRAEFEGTDDLTKPGQWLPQSTMVESKFEMKRVVFGYTIDENYT